MKPLFHLVTAFTLSLSAVETIPLAPGPGVKLFLDSDYRCDYWRLINYFETQITNAFCSIASSVMILNALDIPKPYVERFRYPLFTQEDNFFTPAVTAIVSRETVLRRGSTVSELAKMLNTFEVKATPLHANTLTLETFRSLLMSVLVDPNRYVIADFYRPALGQKGTGHFSPLAAYNAKEDQVLVLDVSRYKHPPFWVKTEDLYNSMLTCDQDVGEMRGLVLIQAH